MATGAFSSPSTIVSRCTSLPSIIHCASCMTPSTARSRKSSTMKPCTRRRFIRIESNGPRIGSSEL